MSTLDDILGNNHPKDAAPKGTLQWTMQQNGENMPPAVQPKPVETAPLPETRVGTPATPQIATPVPPRTANVEDMPRNNEELYKILNRSKKPLTDEELEKARKKEKRDKLFSAIGDGVMALSNLFFTTRGAPSMYTGKHSMSEKTRERYEKLKKEREDNEMAYNEGLRRARLMDERKAEAERAWQRQLGLDEENRTWKQKQLDYKVQQDADAKAHQIKREKIADEHWQKEFDAGNRRANQSHNLAVQQQRDNKALRQQQIAATAANAVRGKQLGFADGSGKQVSIYESVWKSSMQQVYDVLAEDMRAAYEADKKNNPRVPRHKTASEKEDFVKQNWHKSPRASSVMLLLSKLDPANMSSTVNDDVEDYTPSGGDDDKNKKRSNKPRIDY